MLIAQLLTSSGLNVDVPQQLWTHPPSLQPNKVVCQSIEVAYDFLHCSWSISVIFLIFLQLTFKFNVSVTKMLQLLGQSPQIPHWGFAPGAHWRLQSPDPLTWCTTFKNAAPRLDATISGWQHMARECIPQQQQQSDVTGFCQKYKWWMPKATQTLRCHLFLIYFQHQQRGWVLCSLMLAASAVCV